MSLESEFREQFIPSDPEGGKDRERLMDIHQDGQRHSMLRHQMGQNLMRVLTSRSVGRDVQQSGDKARQQREVLADQAARSMAERDERTMIGGFGDYGEGAARDSSGLGL